MKEEDRNWKEESGKEGRSGSRKKKKEDGRGCNTGQIVFPNQNISKAVSYYLE